jgi:selenocysteine lyase/cysteine desulfurase
MNRRVFLLTAPALSPQRSASRWTPQEYSHSLPVREYSLLPLARISRLSLARCATEIAYYETGGIPVIVAAGVDAGIDYVNKLGVSNIRAHAKQLTDRLQTELPPLGGKAST